MQATHEPTVQEIRFACFGNPCHESVTVKVASRPYRFDFEAPKERLRPCHAALFFDYHAASWRNYLRYPRNSRVAVLAEPNASEVFLKKPRLAERFRLVFTHDERLLRLRKNFVNQPFGTSWLNVDINENLQFHKTKLVSMIGSPHAEGRSGHALRNQVIDWLREKGGVDQFGRGIRWINNKIDGLSQYAFSIAMENCSQNFYFSEKLIDCFLTDTVPVYWGCAQIDRYFDPRGYLQFASIDELQKVLGLLSWDRYEAMLPYCRANRQKAIEERWATRPQYLQRLAKSIDAEFSPSFTWQSPTSLDAILQLYRKFVRPAEAGMC